MPQGTRIFFMFIRYYISRFSNIVGSSDEDGMIRGHPSIIALG